MMLILVPMWETELSDNNILKFSLVPFEVIAVKEIQGSILRFWSRNFYQSLKKTAHKIQIVKQTNVQHESNYYTLLF